MNCPTCRWQEHWNRQVVWLVRTASGIVHGIYHLESEARNVAAMLQEKDLYFQQTILVHVHEVTYPKLHKGFHQ